MHDLAVIQIYVLYRHGLLRYLRLFLVTFKKSQLKFPAIIS